MVDPLEFHLPDVGEGIATADIIEWKVAAGEEVREGQDLVEIQTDKAVVVIPCPVTGTVTRLGPPAGESLDVGALLAVFQPQEPDAAPPAVASQAAGVGDESRTDPPGRSGAVADNGTPPLKPAPPQPLAAPATRRLARELGVELADVPGSGPDGRIVAEDVRRAAAPTAGPVPGAGAAPAGAAAAPGPPGARSPAAADGDGGVAGEVVALRGVRRSIAHTLTRAWQEIPHVIDYREVDATRLMQARTLLRQRALDRGEEALARAMTPTVLIVKAAAVALGDHPYVNASIDLQREEITLHKQINIGIATAAPGGLIVPVLHDADQRSVSQIALELASLVRTARERRLGPAQLAGGTFTVNNYGALGVWLGTPIIRPPEVANLGVGAVRDQVVPVDGVPAVRPILALAVSADHRVLDGHTLASFVSQVVRLLEEPLLLLGDLD